MTKFSKPTNIRLRPMQSQDIGAIMAIEQKVYGAHCWSKQGFLNELDNRNGFYYCIFDQHNLIGYGGFWAIFDEGHITTIAVDPDYHNRGMGQAILQKIINKGYELDIKWFTLEVRISNIAAQNLYKKYTFESCGVRHKYYQDTKEDALIMWTEDIQSAKFKSSYTNLKLQLEERLNIESFQ